MKVGDKVRFKRDIPAYYCKPGSLWALEGDTATVSVVGTFFTWVIHDGTHNVLEVTEKDIEPLELESSNGT